MFQIQTSFVSTRNLMMINCSNPNFCCSFLPGFRQKSSKILKYIVQLLCCTFAFMLRPHFMMPISNGKQWACLALFPFLRKKRGQRFSLLQISSFYCGFNKKATHRNFCCNQITRIRGERYIETIASLDQWSMTIEKPLKPMVWGLEII